MNWQVRYVKQGEQIVRQIHMEAADEFSLREQLESDLCIVLSIRQSPPQSTRNASSRGAREYPLFCREIRTLVGAGMTVVEAVDTLAQRSRTTNRNATLATELQSRLSEGQALSAAVATLPGAPPVLIAAVRAGERTNNLIEALDDYLKFDALVQQLKRKIISAAIYPCMVTLLGAGISIFLLLVVMPSFARMYQNMRGKASGVNAMLIDLSFYLNQHQTELLYGILSLVGMTAYWALKGNPVQTASTTISSLPWFRDRIQDFRLAMMYQALALLLRGGYSMAEAMRVAGQAALSEAMRMSLNNAQFRVEQGAPVAKSLADSNLCDEVGRRLMAAAERNGSFHAAAEAVARIHGERFELFVERMTRIIEPVLLLAVALFVGTIVVMMYLPVFDMATRLR